MNLAYPFPPLENEDQFYLYSNIKAKIVGQNNTEISLEPIAGNILITNLRFCWFNFPKCYEELNLTEKQIMDAISSKHGQKKENWQQLNIQGKSFMFAHSRLLSHGIQNNKLRCFLGEDEEDTIQQQNTGTGLEELLEQSHPDQIVDLEFGKYQIEFDLQFIDKNQQEELFENFTILALNV